MEKANIEFDAALKLVLSHFNLGNQYAGKVSTGVATLKERIAELENRLYECQDELRNRTTDVDSMVDEVNKCVTELAAAQATIRQMREAYFALPERIAKFCFGSRDAVGSCTYSAAYLSIAHCFTAKDGLDPVAPPNDRTALDAMLADAEKRGMLKAAGICEKRADPVQEHNALHRAANAIRQAAERSDK